MNWEWMASLDQFWRAPMLPMWPIWAAAALFASIALVTLLRADKSVANVVLTAMSLAGIGIALLATSRGLNGDLGAVSNRVPQPAASASVPALSCVDDLAGETTLTACEKILFGSADTVAAAVTYTADRMRRLASFGDVTEADKAMTPELMALRRSIERDRYGFVAYVLASRDQCQSASCPFFRNVSDQHQIAANMNGRMYESAIIRYSPSWGAPAQPALVNAPLSAALQSSLPPSVPSGKPTTADFPSAASIPPVNIMTPEPTAAAPKESKPSAAAANGSPPPKPAAPKTVAVAPKKPAAPKPRAAGPVRSAPSSSETPDAPPASAASGEQ